MNVKKYGIFLSSLAVGFLLFFGFVCMVENKNTFSVNADTSAVDDMTLEWNGSGYSVTKYSGNYANVVIPSEYDNNPVTSISANAFKENASMMTLSIPDSITFIDERAFYHCQYLETVILGSSVGVIGEGAFQDCESLSTVYYKGVNDYDWTQIFLNDGNDRLQSAARYYYSETYPEIFVANTSYWYYHEGEPTVWKEKVVPTEETEGAFTYLNDTDGTKYTVTGYSGNFACLIVPNTYKNLPVTEIAAEVFFGHSEITSVMLGDNMMKIDEYAFTGCTEIQNTYYQSDESAWQIVIKNSDAPSNEFLFGQVRYYSESYPKTFAENTYWKYVNGVAILWTIEEQPSEMSCQLNAFFGLSVTDDNTYLKGGMQVVNGSGVLSDATATYMSIWESMPSSPDALDGEIYLMTYDERDKMYIGRYKGLPAKQICDTFYFVMYATVNGRTYHTDILTYGIYQYAETRLNEYPGEKETDNNYKLNALLISLLDYGAMSQRYFNYRTDDLANKNVTYAMREKYGLIIAQTTPVNMYGNISYNDNKQRV